MSMKPPDLGKGPFWYRRAAVDQVLADRDLMFRYVQQRTRDAEARVVELEAALAATGAAEARKDEDLARLGAQLTDLTNRFAEVDRWRQRVEAEAQRLGAWRTRVLTTAGSTAARLKELHDIMDTIPERVEQAFAPVIEGEASLQRRMGIVVGILKSVPPSPLRGRTAPVHP